MWALILSGLLVGATVSATNQDAWCEGNTYEYKLKVKSLTALQEVSNEFAGVQIVGDVHAQLINSSSLAIQLKQVRVAEIHKHLPGGWDAEIPDTALNYKPLHIPTDRFNLKYSNGVITNITVSRKCPNWVLNFIKAVASPLQLNIRGTNSHLKPNPRANSAVFSTMEAVVTGECATTYVYGPYPKYAALSDEDLIADNWEKDQNLYEVTKSVNFTDCNERAGYTWGLNTLTHWEPVENSLGKAFSRSSSSEAVISGSPRNYTIQKSITTNIVTINPLLYVQQKGMLGSQVKIVLANIKQSSSHLPVIKDPKIFKDIVYQYPEPAPLGSSGSGLPPSDSASQSDGGSASNEASASDVSANEDVSADRIKPRMYWSGRGRRAAGEYSHSEEEVEYVEPVPLPDLDNAPYLPSYEPNPDEKLPELTTSTISLVEKIARELLDPDSIPARETLGSFQILDSQLAQYNARSLLQIAQKLYAPYPENPHSRPQALKYLQWVVLNNALSQTGTGPALTAIIQLVKQRKLQGSLAANVIGSLPRSVLFPNQPYIKAFFSLVKITEDRSPENVTAALALGELLRQASVDKLNAHNRYPIHIYGSLSPMSSRDLNPYIGYLSGLLKEAVRDADSVRIQVYIRALGNIGHPSILKVFSPYLLGEKVVSDYQRLLFVLSLVSVAKLHPKAVRPILVQTYQSTGETDQVRSAAVLLIMGTNPPANILERLAQFSNQDPSPLVISVVKTALETAAKLTTPQYEELSRNARAAVDMVNPNRTAIQYSAKFLTDHIVRDMGLSYNLMLSRLGSRDTLIQNGLFGSLNLNIGGLQHLSGEAQATVSSFKSLREFVKYMIVEPEEESDIRKRGPAIDNIITDLRQQIEGQFVSNIISHQSMFAYDNNTLNELRESFKKNIPDLEKGIPFNQTQIVSSADVRICFPNAAGFFSKIEYKSSVLYSVGGELSLVTSERLDSAPRGHISWPNMWKISADVKAVYSRRVSGGISFQFPSVFKTYAAGYVKNSQLQLPIRINANIDRENNGLDIKLQPIEKNHRYQLAHMSSVPFTRIYPTYIPTPLLSSSDTKVIHVRKPRVWKAEYGRKSTGVAFAIEYRSEKEYQDKYWLYQHFEKHDSVSAVLFGLDEYEIYPSNISLYYEPEKSISKAVEVSLNYDESSAEPQPGQSEGQSQSSEDEEAQRPDFSGEGEEGGKSSSEEGEDKESSDENYGRDKRSASYESSESALPQKNRAILSGSNLNEQRKEVLRILPTPGLNYTRKIASAEVKFVGGKGASWLSILSWSSSPVNSRSDLIAHVLVAPPQSEEPYKVCLDVKAVFPSVPFMNLDKALKANPNSSLSIRLDSGRGSCRNGMKISGRLNIGRSYSWLQHLLNSEILSVCKYQMKRVNNVQPACRNATISAGSMNDYYLLVKYSNVSYEFSNASYRAFSLLSHVDNLYVSENSVNSSGKPGQLTARLNVAPNLSSFNFSFATKKLEAIFSNVRIIPAVGKLLLTHPLIPRLERWANYLTYDKYNATCSLDASAIKTFDNRTFIYKPDNACWKVLLATARLRDVRPSPLNSSPNVTVMARQISASEREIKVLVGKNVITLIPVVERYLLKVNKHLAVISKSNVTVMNDLNGKPLVVAYGLPDSVRVEVQGLIIYFDRQRVLLQAGDSYRREVRGLCGTFDGQPLTDFKVPANCIVRNVTDFIDAYSHGENCPVPTELSGRPRHCYHEDVIPGNQTSEISADSECIISGLKVVIRNGKVCFSLQPVPMCRLRCEPRDSVTKVIPYRCYKRSNTVEKYIAQVKKGISIDIHGSISVQGEDVKIKSSIPTVCERRETSSSEEV